MDQAITGQQPAPCCCHAEHLTDRELDVLCQLAAGLTNDQAAAAMNVSRHTIAGHLCAMLARASARNRAELVARAYAAGVLSPHAWPPRPSGRRCLTLPAPGAPGAGQQAARAGAPVRGGGSGPERRAPGIQA